MQPLKANINQHQLDSKIQKAISLFSEHFMSNAKWIKLIEKLIENADKVLKIEFKKVQGNQIGILYLNKDTAFELDYWQNGFEGNNSIGGWLTFKEIEYLIFPKIVDSKNDIKQDLNQIEELIKTIGQFNLDINDERLKLQCYK